MRQKTAWSRKVLGYDFVDEALLQQALTHKSLAASNNERLEFLGDAVLGLVVAAALYGQESDTDEGTLSRLRASLVRRETLAELAADSGLGDVISLGSGESRSGGHQRRSILADALEAVFGAVYCDQGYAAAERVVLKLYADRLADLPALEDLKDPKTTLQELLQGRSIDIPVYRVLHEEGPPHARHFLIECQVEKLDVRVTGTGSSRRRAEQAAADAALMAIQVNGYGAS